MKALLAALVCCAALTLPACGPTGPEDVPPNRATRAAAALEPEPLEGEGPDPFDVVYRVELHDGRLGEFHRQALPPSASRREPFPRQKEGEPSRRPGEPFTKLHPLVKEWLAGRSLEEREQVIVSFRSDLVMPRFPRSGPEGPSPRVRERADQLIAEITRERSRREEELLALARRLGGRVVQRFWLIDGAVLELPLRSIQPLADETSVIGIDPAQAPLPPRGKRRSAEPQQHADTDRDVDDGRARVHSDDYFALQLGGGSIALLDTGVRSTHHLFNCPKRLRLLADCTGTGGVSKCTIGSSDDCLNHGTMSAGILSGNDRLANPYRGVTEALIDSFRVYSCTATDNQGALIALEEAWGADVIVVEMQEDGVARTSLSQAADMAFDRGSVVISPTGNHEYGPTPGSVKSPGDSHRVIGVGAYDVVSGAPFDKQAAGPTSDGRIKPDLQMPTNTWTASIDSDTAIGLYAQTSGAAPYAAGVALLLRNLIRKAGLTDPGQVYSLLILSGQRSYPFDQTVGAGPSVLWKQGELWWGKTEVSDGETVVVTLTGSLAAPRRLDAALWWPEHGDYPSTQETHNDVDLLLISPSGSTCTTISPSGSTCTSEAVGSVFERVRLEGTLEPGDWSLAIRGYQVGSPSQTVYWAAALNP